MDDLETESAVAYHCEDSGTPVATWVALQHLGFMPEDDFYGCPSMSYDFCRFKLRATRTMNRWMQDVVSFDALISTPRTLGTIEFDMPLSVESNGQCAAWIAWHIKKYFQDSQEKIISHTKIDLLVIGLQHLTTLPWERARILREQKAERYRLRPSCTVARAMIKLGLKSVAKYIEQSADDDQIEIWFDGQILSFQINGKRVIVQADGSAWKAHYLLPAEALKAKPRRLYCEAVDVSIWNDRLQIDRSRYDGVVEIGLDSNCLAKS